MADVSVSHIEKLISLEADYDICDKSLLLYENIFNMVESPHFNGLSITMDFLVSIYNSARLELIEQSFEATCCHLGGKKVLGGIIDYEIDDKGDVITSNDVKKSFSLIDEYDYINLNSLNDLNKILKISNTKLSSIKKRDRYIKLLMNYFNENILIRMGLSFFSKATWLMIRYFIIINQFSLKDKYTKEISHESNVILVVFVMHWVLKLTKFPFQLYITDENYEYLLTLFSSITSETFSDVEKRLLKLIVQIAASHWKDFETQCDRVLKVNLTTLSTSLSASLSNSNIGDEITPLSNKQQTEVEKAATTHRKEQKSTGVCFVCYDDSTKPTIALLCCGQPAHIFCINRWYCHIFSCEINILNPDGM